MKNKRLIALAASLGLAVMGAVPMCAGAAAPEETAAPEKTFTFEKYLVMEKDANVPNVSFGFSVTPAADTDIAATEKNVRPGPAGIKFIASDGVTVGETGTSASVSFTGKDDKLTEASSSTDKSIDFVTPDREDEVYACKELTLDLDGIEFKDPGIYRYIITENEAENVAGVSPDTNRTRNLDIYVMRDTSGSADADEFIVEGFVFYYGTNNKSTGFTNQYVTNNLAVGKSVTGNQGSKNKHFKISVKLTNPDELTISNTDKFSVIGNLENNPEGNDITVYSADEMKSNNVTELTYEQLSEGYSFYLCSGHDFEIKGIPTGLGYEITEYQEEYAPSVEYASGSDNMTDDKTGDGTEIEGEKGDATDDADKTYTVKDTFLSADTSITFKNDLAGTIPTGILNTVAGSLGLVAVGAAGITGGAMLLKKKKTGEDAES